MEYGKLFNRAFNIVWTQEFLVLLGLLGFLFYNTGGPAPLRPVGLGAGAVVGIVGCLLLPVSLVPGLLRTFANRAAMLEGHGVVAAYARGFTVPVENLGQGIVIFVLQVGVSLLLAVLLLVPGVIVALCFLLWPLIWLFEGLLAAFFSAVWTLAWRRWTTASAALKFGVEDVGSGIYELAWNEAE